MKNSNSWVAAVDTGTEPGHNNTNLNKVVSLSSRLMTTRTEETETPSEVRDLKVENLIIITLTILSNYNKLLLLEIPNTSRNKHLQYHPTSLVKEARKFRLMIKQ